MRSLTHYHTLKQDVLKLEDVTKDGRLTLSHPKEGGCQDVTSVALVCLCDDSCTLDEVKDTETCQEDWCINTNQMEELYSEM